jgi:hypothetical protein
MFIHEAFSYNETPQLYSVLTGIVCCKGTEVECCDQACTNQLASLITSYLNARLSLIFMSIRGIRCKVKQKKKENIEIADMIEWLAPYKRVHEACDCCSRSPTIG